jgi:predicted alpha/beta-fold hydrolase
MMNSSLMTTPFKIYRMQETPVMIVILGLGLNGAEDSPYAVDLIRALPQNILIIAVRGVEACEGTVQEKFYVKSDYQRVLWACVLARRISTSCPLVGVGISLGGGLILQAHSAHPGLFHGVVMVSTSIWYEHALKTMCSTWQGWLANKVLIWWQFSSLFWKANYLHQDVNMTWLHWLRLFFASSMLSQDTILCERYGLDTREYINGLDLRKSVTSSPRVYFLASTNDPMFSPEHMRETRLALEGSSVKSVLTDVGSHGEFTKLKRNDYLIEYVTECLTELSSSWQLNLQ